MISEFVKESVDFLKTNEGAESDGSSKETQNLVIDFLTDLFKNEGIEENDVIEIWQDIFWSEIK